ncbi:MAG: transcription termination factor Rho [Syntrophaceae bacterium]|nr:transcription termination factor Rho [Deltaproteobacteria bacterium]
MSEETRKKSHKEDKPLEKMTVKDLKEIALEIPHDHLEIAVSDMHKDQLVAFIKEARGIREESPGKKVKKAKVIKVALTKQEIKARIRKLKEEQASAQELKDGEKAQVLRRRISRLKKQSRKIF